MNESIRSIIGVIQRWGPIAVSIVAVTVSIFALKISKDAAQVDEFYKEVSIAPVLELRYNFTDGITIEVENRGAGVAVIQQIRPMNISPSKRLFRIYGDKAIEKAKECASIKYPSFANTTYFAAFGTAVRPGERVHIFGIQFLQEDKTKVTLSEEQAKSYYECEDNLNVQVCYCSLSGKTCQMMSSRGYFESGFACGSLVAAPEGDN